MSTVIFNRNYCIKELYNELGVYATEKYSEELTRYRQVKGISGEGLPRKNMYDFIRYVVGVSKNNFPKYVTCKDGKESKNLNVDQKQLLDACFGKAPIYLDVEQFQKKLLLSSNKLFSSNEKSCLAVMIDRSKIDKWWSAGEIVDEVEKYGVQGFTVLKVEECLNKHCDGTHKLYDRIGFKGGSKGCRYKYRIRLTDLIRYINENNGI